MISTAVTALVNEYAQALQKEEYSLSYALAFGYVNNFIEPVITHQLGQRKEVRLLIFIPELLSDLEPRSIDRMMAMIRQRFSSEVMNLELKEGRARDVLTISQGQSDKVFFDFPNTLLTLNSLIEYKIESKRSTFSDEEKRKVGAVYIQKFKKTLEKLLSDKGLSQYIQFVDKGLKF